MNEATLKRARIFIADDEVSNICLLVNFLNRTGYNDVRGFTDPEELVPVVEANPPDLLILDLGMPVMDGYAVMEHLKRFIAREAFPVLILTGDPSPQRKRRALAAGASDILQKPFDSTEVYMRIRNLLERHFLNLELQNQNLSLEKKVAERTRELEVALAELKEAQQQVVQRERFRAFGEMAGGIVHDFNNALMSVIGYSEILLQDPAMLEDKTTLSEYLRIMNTAGRDASQVIRRLRDFYRPREEGDVFSPLNLNMLLEEVVPLTQPKWRDQALGEGRTIQVDLDLEKIPWIQGNATELREVATNLIFNAVDAMPHGGTITICTRNQGERVMLEISDTGVGMTEEALHRCMEPFFSTKGEKGTGLGLSMVFGIIKRHEGSMEIQSTLGKGTTFQIWLPNQAAHSQSASTSVPAMDRQLDVLVVDDEPVALDVVKKYLTSAGHHVMTASNGYDALEIFQKNRFDLLLTDHAMPGMNGIQLAALVKQLHNPKPVIMLTGFDDPALTPGQCPPNVDRLIRKPIPPAELNKAVAELIAPGA